jgi:ketosteroid isomerase-like protein
MKISNLMILTIICFFVLSCDKDQSLNSSGNTNPGVNFEFESSQHVISDNAYYNGRNTSRMNSVDQKAIKAAREANNAALKARNAQKVAENYLESFFLLTSTNGFFAGKERVTEIYQSVFNTREAVLFIRTPTAITVNNDWQMASENGQWIGTWIVNGENIRVAGDYYAKWHRIDGIWKLKCEVYTQFMCKGDVVCNNKPSLL